MAPEIRIRQDSIPKQSSFGLSLAPHTFSHTHTKCVDAALALLRQRSIRILNYLDDWLILAQSEREILVHRSVILQHLDNLGLKIDSIRA